MQRRWLLALLALVALVLTGLAASAFRAADRADGKKAAQRADWEAFLQEYDADKDGQLTKEEVPGWLHHNFARLDANKDGKLSKDELEKGAAYLQQRRRPSDVIAVLVEMSDCDECCAEELQLVYETLRKIDRNNDGKIDADELKGGRASIIKERVDGLFKDLDKDRDGKISKSEARGQIRAHFAELDRNKDGSVDRDELVAAASAKPDKATDKPASRPEK